MDLLLIRGGRRIEGRVAVAGSKNATLPIMAASLMVDGPVMLEGVPDLADVTTLSRVLESLGVLVQQSPQPGQESRRLTLSVSDASNCVADYDLVRRMRASVCVLGPLVAKRGQAVVSLPGGCNIGDRPIDLHLRGLAALGADVRLERGYVVARAKRLKGADVDLAGPRGSTVTGTANILAAATLAEGRSILRNAALEPEVTDLASFLVAAGACIEGIGSPVLEVTGVDSLHPVVHRVIPDRIEAATLMMAAAITGGELILDGVDLSHLATVTAAMEAAGIRIEETAEASPLAASPLLQRRTIRVSAAETLSPVDVTARPYSGFPTDLQAQWMTLMTKTAAGARCQITDEVFPDRFLHVAELARLGAEITRFGSTAIVRGGYRLRGANVMASDLRASAALVLAALAAEGETVIRRIYHLDRGYERLDRKLAALGADVSRRTDESAIAVPPPFPAA